MSEPSVRLLNASVRLAPRVLLGVVLAAVAYGCSSQQGAKRLADGSYRVDCERPLLPCLEPAAKACEEHGYDVVSASEVRDRYGPSPWQLGVVKSSATVRCRATKRGFSFFHGEEPVPGPALSASAAPARSAVPAQAPAPVPPAPPGCVPGTSQACAAVSGCSGAQVCAADGRSFGPCECASRAPVAAPPAVVP
jgi:hypothetical protein